MVSLPSSRPRSCFAREGTGIPCICGWLLLSLSLRHGPRHRSVRISWLAPFLPSFSQICRAAVVLRRNRSDLVGQFSSSLHVLQPLLVQSSPGFNRPIFLWYWDTTGEHRSLKQWLLL